MRLSRSAARSGSRRRCPAARGPERALTAQAPRGTESGLRGAAVRAHEPPSRRWAKPSRKGARLRRPRPSGCWLVARAPRGVVARGTPLIMRVRSYVRAMELRTYATRALPACTQALWRADTTPASFVVCLKMRRALGLAASRGARAVAAARPPAAAAAQFSRAFAAAPPPPPSPVSQAKLADSFADGSSVSYLEELEARFRENPRSVDKSWANFFSLLGAPQRRRRCDGSSLHSSL